MPRTKPKPMRIVNLHAENIKRLVAVDITPDSSLVQITGKNGAGKTSVLDAIWWAFTGTRSIQTKPIRDGEEAGLIVLDMGELIITRTFRKAMNDLYTTKITVENADGAVFRSPQTMLDELIGDLSLDPLEFARMKGKEQFDALRKFVPEIDFDAEMREYEGLYEERRELNKKALSCRAAAEQIELPDDPAPTFIDVSALTDELAAAASTNGEVDAQQREYDDAGADVAQLIERIKLAEDKLVYDRDALATMQERLSGFPPIPKKIDPTELREKIKAAERHNYAVEDFEKHKEHTESAASYQAQAANMQIKMNQWHEARDAKIKAAKLPVKGLEFGDNEIHLAGQPFNQASDAEQLRASVAIAMAANPTLRVIRIRDGSLLDDNSLKLIAQMADKNDYQVWIERVDSSGKIGFVIEEGEISGAASEPPTV